MFGIFKRPPGGPDQRKQRSEERLRKKGISVSSHLPVIADAGPMRSAQEVFDRITALWEVVNNALGTEDADKESSKDFLNDIDVWQALTPLEQHFLSGKHVEEQELTDLTWKTEEIKALYWVLVEIQDLGAPDKEAEEVIFGVSERITERIDDMEVARHAASMRKGTEILDALDYVSRLHWASREHRRGTTGVPPTYQMDIIQEWHAALLG